MLQTLPEPKIDRMKPSSGLLLSGFKKKPRSRSLNRLQQSYRLAKMDVQRQKTIKSLFINDLMRKCTRICVLFLSCFVVTGSTFAPQTRVSALVPGYVQMDAAWHAKLDHLGTARMGRLIAVLRNPDKLNHFSETDLYQMFGSPNLLRKQSDNHVWHYQASNCTLDVYYPKRGSKPALIDQHETMPVMDAPQNAGRPPLDRLCVLQLALSS